MAIDTPRRTLCWAAKGGSGVTTVVAAIGLHSSRSTLAVDLVGDLAMVLGVDTTEGHGVDDWLRSAAEVERLATLEVVVTPKLSVLPWSRTLGTPIDDERWRRLAATLARSPRDVVIDAGNGEPHPAVVAIATHRVLVTRPCYLALRHASRQAVSPTDVVVIDEPGRSLRTPEIEAVLGAPVTAHAMVDPAVARAIDAGLVVARLPRGFRREIGHLAA